MSVEKLCFGAYTLYKIKNAAGASASVIDLGAAVQSIIVPDKNGVLGDVVLGYDTPQEYLDNDGYFGASVGRYANRIAGAGFDLNGTHYSITANEGANTLHGGVGFSKRRFDVTSVSDNSVRFELFDPDGGDGFPGNVTVSVEYEFTEDNKLVISYTARSDKDTVLNLTNHSYFNLAGRGDILSHELMINADSYLPVDDELIPTGEVRPVDGTPFDFRTRREVKNGFYDHCFVLNGEKSAELYEPECGRIMRVMTDMPAVQFYAGGATGTRNGKNGAVYGKNSALCLETQFYPDAPNRPDFPTTVLKANEIYSHRTVYEFSTDKSVTTIRVDEYAFSVDVEKTREYYKTHALCNCANCRNFYAQVRGKLPKLDEFLTQFGVDISHPDEIWSVETDDGIDYISADYTVCGRVEEMGKYEIDLHDEQFLSVIVTDGFTSPNEQTGEYFTLSVNNISLPWGLDEPIPEPIKATAPSKPKRFFGKIFG